jgi:hypothetical protein
MPFCNYRSISVNVLYTCWQSISMLPLSIIFHSILEMFRPNSFFFILYYPLQNITTFLQVKKKQNQTYCRLITITTFSFGLLRFATDEYPLVSSNFSQQCICLYMMTMLIQIRETGLNNDEKKTTQKTKDRAIRTS